MATGSYNAQRPPAVAVPGASTALLTSSRMTIITPVKNISSNGSPKKKRSTSPSHGGDLSRRGGSSGFATLMASSEIREVLERQTNKYKMEEEAC